MKKLITVVLVLVMLVRILALPAAAANVQPRYPVIACDCGGTARGMSDGNGNILYFKCDSCGAIYYPK